MKRKATLLSVLILFLVRSFQLSAQKDEINPNHFRNPVWFGFNMGGTWQTSEVSPLAGLGLGFTLGKNYLTFSRSKIFWGWRFRYLYGTNYGQDWTKNYGLQNNTALNGSTDSTTDYYHHGGFVYNNYKMTFNEWSLEVLLGPNLINKRTGSGPLMYLFGGVGLVKTTTMMDMKDANGQRYNFASIDSTGTASKTTILNALASKQDGTYETAADGGAPTWKFMPSIGIGLGYQWSNVFQLGVEYKLTFARNDVIDGSQWTNNNTPFGTNDKYNYASAYISLGFGGRTRTHTQTTNNVTNADNFSHTNVTNPPPSGAKPFIQVTYPTLNPFTSIRNEAQLNARVLNVNNPNDVSLTLNGASVSSWTFNPYTGILNADLRLMPGSNEAVIYARNEYGNSSVSQSFQFAVPDRGIDPPQVHITSPQGNPYYTTVPNAGVSATVVNVTSPDEIRVMINGNPTNDYSYDQYSKVLRLNLLLNPGNNVVSISAMNQVGSDSKSLTLDYTPPVFSGSGSGEPPLPPPVVTILNPGTNPSTSNNPGVNVVASVVNVLSGNDIQVMVNGINYPNFSYSVQTHLVQFYAPLNYGNNSVYVSGTNPSGTDYRNINIEYVQPNIGNVPTTPPPVVNIVNPYANPYTTTANVVAVEAHIMNITGANQIQLQINGMNSGNFSYVPSTHTMVFTTSLLMGNNLISITANNGAGTDSKSLTVIENPVVINTPRPPVVTFNNPNASPYNTQYPTILADASIRNIQSANQIQLSINGNYTNNFSFNPSTHDMQFNTSLNSGHNQISVTATNSDGTDTKTAEVVYTPAQVIPKPVVTITYPGANPYNSPSPSVGITATVLNVNSQNDIQVTYNNNPFTGFHYNPNNRSLTIGLNSIMGTNSVTITATNSAGSDSKTQTIIYNTPPPVGNPPVITITTPASSIFVTSDMNAGVVNATIQNVNFSNQISVTCNGSPVGFNFNPNTKQLALQTQLIFGSNTFLIHATNQFGTDSKTTTINLNQPVNTRNPPNTGSGPGGGVSDGGGSHGNNGGNGNNGNNGGGNSSGNGTGTGTGTGTNPNTRNPPGTNGGGGGVQNGGGGRGMQNNVNVPAPSVNITSPGNNYQSPNAQVNVSASLINVSSSAQISVKVNGQQMGGFNFNPNSHQLTFTANLNPGMNSIEVRASTTGGMDTKTLSVQYSNNRAPSGRGGPPPPPRR